MSKTYFISDVHLGLSGKDQERAKEQRLLAFLEHVKNTGNQLFIVGDLFDAWFEYRTVIPKGFHRVLSKLHDLTDHGIIVYYLAGNHDYWIRDYFRDELAMKTYYDPFDTIVDGKKIYLHHGDGLAGKDTGYKILKKILRNPFNIWLYSWLHPDIGIKLARSSSKKSRHYTSGKEYGEQDGMVKLATQKIEEGYDAVIMGHRHQPASQTIGKGLYINLGDWITHCTYAEIDNGHIALKKWE